MFRNTFFLACCVGVFMVGCAEHDAQPTLSKEASHARISDTPRVIVNDVNKTDASEAALFMSAVDSMDNGNFTAATGYFEQLFTLTHKKEYRLDLARLYSIGGSYAKANEILRERVAEVPDDMEAKKMLATNYIQTKEYDKAAVIAQDIAQKTHKKADYDMAGNIAYVAGDLKGALTLFRRSYAIKADNASADRIATTQYELGEKGDASRFLETHIRMFGCSTFLCDKLAKLYLEQNDERGALEVYKKLYFKHKDTALIQKIIELSVSVSDVDGLIRFLKKTHKNDVLLLEAYKYKQDDKSAAELALRLYKKTNDANFLAQYAIFHFESHKVKTHAVILESINKLTVAVSKVQNDVYDNYLGYLLIDYDVDVTRGIDYVKRALKKDPTSPFYLDSLAWGYYKQKKCADAAEIMKKVLPQLKDDKTVQEHNTAIQRCMQVKR